MPSLTVTAEAASPRVTAPGQTRPAAAAVQKATYGQILKSTSQIGAASVVTILFGIVRTKAMALFLGPAGVGVMGLYNSVAELTQGIAGMGVQSSGVRQIAEAVGSGREGRIAVTATVLRRISVLLGVLGAGGLALLAAPVSYITFGTYERAAGVALLALAVFCKLVSQGQSALIQGMRRISDLAAMSVLAAVLSTAISIPVVYVFREDGIVPSLIAVAAVTLATSWWYSRRVRVQPGALALRDMRRETAALLKLGAAFMASGFLTIGGAYVIRIIVLREAGFAAAGLYQAAWVIGGLYVGFILQAMGADFYPRLTAVCNDNGACTRLVNEQAHISLLLAGPGVIATLTAAPLVIAIFYSPDFRPAVDLLRWICLGMTLRVVAWPMGFVILAKGAQQVFFWTEVAATAVHVGLAWFLVSRVGVNGAGMAFFGLYVWHGLLIYVVVRRLSGFRWSRTNRQLGLFFLPLTALVFSGFYLFPFWLAAGVGSVAVLISSLYSVRILVRLVPRESWPSPLRQFLARRSMGMPDGTHGEGSDDDRSPTARGI